MGLTEKVGRPEQACTGLGSAGRWGRGAGSVVCLESYFDCSFGYFEPLRHAVHGDPVGAGGG